MNYFQVWMHYDRVRRAESSRSRRIVDTPASLAYAFSAAGERDGVDPLFFT